MEKLKNMWKDMSKPGKLFTMAIVAILIIVLVNYII
jgi:flagellar biosynthesis/type III secretory pathway M-ring protein FliF/YscJ